MPGINKEAFLKRIGEGATSPTAYGPGESADEDMAPGEEPSEGMSCGEQLLAAVNSKDPVAIDAALKEAVAKYSGG